MDNAGGQEFMLYVEDRSEPGAGADQFRFTVLFNSNVPDDEQGFILDEDGDRTSAGELETLDGGNTVVPHSPSHGGEEGNSN